MNAIWDVAEARVFDSRVPLAAVIYLLRKPAVERGCIDGGSPWIDYPNDFGNSIRIIGGRAVRKLDVAAFHFRRELYQALTAFLLYEGFSVQGGQPFNRPRVIRIGILAPRCEIARHGVGIQAVCGLDNQVQPAAPEVDFAG